MFLCTIDPASKLDKVLLPPQALLELLVAGFLAADVLYDAQKESFLDINQWAGVTVNRQKEVTRISWQERFAGGTIDFQWLPDTLLAFALTGSNMEGTLDTGGLPRGLQWFSVQRNELAGQIDLQRLSSGLVSLELFLNRFLVKLTFEDFHNPCGDSIFGTMP